MSYDMQRKSFSEKSASEAFKSVTFDNAAAAEAGTDLSLTRLKQQQQQNRLRLIEHDGQTSLKDCTV